MPEYIEREVVIEKSHSGVVYIDDIKNIPAVDLAPVRHGQWLHHTIIDGHTYAECCKCHKVRIIDNYCSNCGALMEGE